MFGIGSVLGGASDFLGLSPYKGKAPEYNEHYQLPGFQSQYDQYGNMANKFGGRQAPQMRESDFRGDQRGLVNMLNAQARGHGPGQELVRRQAQNIADRGAQQQMAMAKAQAPGMGAQSARNAAFGAAQLQSGVGGQAAQAGLQAQLGAIGQLGQVTGQARGQDLARGQANMQSQLQSRGMNDQAQLEALRQRLQASGMQQQGGLAYEQNAANYQAARMAQPTGAQTMLGMAQGAGTAYLMGGMGGGAVMGPPTGGQRATATTAGSNPNYAYGFNPYNY